MEKNQDNSNNFHIVLLPSQLTYISIVNNDKNVKGMKR